MDLWISQRFGSVFEGLILACIHGFIFDSSMVSNLLSKQGGSTTRWSLMQNICGLLILKLEIRICHSRPTIVHIHWQTYSLWMGFTLILYQRFHMQISSLFLVDIINYASCHIRVLWMKENVVEKRNFIKSDYLYISTNWSLTKETNKYITLITFLKIKPKRIDTEALLKGKKT